MQLIQVALGRGREKKGTFEPFWATHWYKPAIEQTRWRAQPQGNPIKLTKYDESIAQLKEILQIFEWFHRLKIIMSYWPRTTKRKEKRTETKWEE